MPRLRFACTAAICIAILFASVGSTGATQGALPTALSDAEFSKLTGDLSETGASSTLPADVLSRDLAVSVAAREVAERVKPGGVYLGIGHEENYTYIAASRPRIAFITNAERSAMHLHLMYKALCELAADRNEFISLLFTKPRQPGLTTAATAADVINAYWPIRTSSEDVYKQNLAAIREALTTKHRLRLSPQDLAGVEKAYYHFYWFGPSMHAGSVRMERNAGYPMFSALMMVRDPDGRENSFLATEERFAFVKELHSRNLIVPLVGGLDGPKTLRAIGEFLRTRSAAVSGFYVSGVEATLTPRGLRASYCANLASLPIDESSMFIRPGRIANAITVQGIRGTRRDSGRGLAIAGAPVIQVSVPPDNPAVTPIGDELKTCK